MHTGVYLHVCIFGACELDYNIDSDFKRDILYCFFFGTVTVQATLIAVCALHIVSVESLSYSVVPFCNTHHFLVLVKYPEFEKQRTIMMWPKNCHEGPTSAVWLPVLFDAGNQTSLNPSPLPHPGMKTLSLNNQNRQCKQT